MRKFTHDVCGLQETATYDSETLTEVMVPLIRRWSSLAQGLGRRMIVFLAGAPGSGKSNLAVSLQELSHEMDDVLNVTAISLDGFHYNNDYLKTHAILRGTKELTLSQIKGAPETFDLNRLRAKLVELRSKRRVQVPTYSRKKHEVDETGFIVEDRIVIVEGNYLLLDEPGWRGLTTYSNDSLFLEATTSELKSRILKRKMAGGRTKDQATQSFELSDEPNIRRVNAHRVPASITLEQSGVNHLIMR